MKKNSKNIKIKKESKQLYTSKSRNNAQKRINELKKHKKHEMDGNKRQIKMKQHTYKKNIYCTNVEK